MGQDGEPQAGGGARPAALLVTRITPADVGKRVTVRYRIDDGQLTDVLGYLRIWRDAQLVVEKESGELVLVSEHDVVAAKVIPPRQPRVAATRQDGDATR